MFTPCLNCLIAHIVSLVVLLSLKRFQLISASLHHNLTWQSTKISFSKMLILLLLSTAYSASLAANQVHLNFLLGSEAVLSCVSSYPPPWTRTGSNGDLNIIGVSGEKRPNWDEPRFHFYSNKSLYGIQITDVRMNDAGKYI